MSEIKFYALSKQLTKIDKLNIALARTALAAASIALLDVHNSHSHYVVADNNVVRDDVASVTVDLRRALRTVAHQLDVRCADRFDDDAQRALIASSQRVLDAHAELS
jgi:hypothetical protein